jgi:hypothetical protein
MKRLALLLGAGAAAILLSACAEDYPHGYGGGYGYDQGGPMDVWYDGYYGPYDGGYWDGEAFYYHDRTRGFMRDDGGHFHHQRFEGGHGFRSVQRPH